MRGKRHDETTRAAVLAALLAGQGVDEVATQYQLPKATVSRWKSGIGPQLEQVGTKKATDFGELLAGYLRENLTTLTAQARHFRDPDWLAKQSAADLAMLHGVATDKAIRLLEAAERAAERAASDPTLDSTRL